MAQPLSPSVIAAFAAIVGKDNVFFDEADQLAYQDKFAIDDALHHPAGAVAPTTVEQVQAIVRVASERGLSLWPISRGKNLGYGGSAPLLAGSVVLDMSRMKKIDYDEANGTVLLEPGVGFYDLYDFLKSRGMKHWLSVPGNSWGSVVGNARHNNMAQPLSPSVIAAFAAIVGKDNVFFDEADQLAYQDKFAIDDALHHPAGAVAPTTVEQVQAIVRVASERGLSLWPISRGKNLGYGGSAPLLAGSVVLDMSRMKKIDYDEANGTVLLEPGVGFYDLYDFLKSRGMKHWLSVPGNSWGSVVGNARHNNMAQPLSPSVIAAFAAIVGKDNVFFDEADQLAYQDKFAIDDALHHPAGAVAPTTVEQVQAIVRVASERGLSLWPISRGKNLGYGGSAPLLAGSVVLDMSRMKKIDYDEANGTVLLEPGVGFYDLYDFLKSRGMKHWLSVPGNSWGSVVGNARHNNMAQPLSPSVIAAFAAIVGKDNVFFDEADQLAYQDKFAIDDALHHPAGAVAPTTVEQVQAIVRVASERGLSLWPISRGKNLGYGGSAPLLAGSVVLDMSRMKKIDYDEANGTVLLEPGVGFYDLYDFLKSRGMKHWLSVPGNSWGSVVGNALDRGVGYTPYGEHAARICGIEAVMADGLVVRTGMGALDGAPTWQLYRFGFGPSWDQMFVQSNFGIVTKMGLWLMPAPESLMGMDLEFDRPEDLGPLIDAIAPLRREGLLQQSPTIGNWLRAAAVLTTRDQWTDKPGALGDDVIAAIRKKFNVGWWGVSLRLYGRESVNKAAYAVLEQAMSALKPMAMRPTSWKTGEPMEASGWTGTPLTMPMQNANWHGGRGGHVGFSPILPQSGAAAMAQFQRTYARYKEYGMDYQASFAFGERHLINVNAVLINKDDPALMGRVDPFLKQLIADAKAQGYGEYRTHLDYMDAVAATYDFNKGSLWQINRKVKDALDPNGVIAPGKSGIWPTRKAGGRA